MKKGKLVNGSPILIIKIDHYVKIGDFAVALTDHFFKLHENTIKDVIELLKKLKKKEANKILKHQLFYYGLKGEFGDGFFESSEEKGEEYNLIYSEARKWVMKNYPYLQKK